MLKKSTKYFIASIALIAIVSIGISALYIFIPNQFNEINNKLRDMMLVMRGTNGDSGVVTIIDIDEKSIKMLGQWPWSRDIISNMLNNLSSSNAKVVAFDVIFAETDSKSPVNILKKYNLYSKNLNIPDYDDMLSKIVAKTDTILGYQFELEKKDYINKNTPSVPAIYIQRNKNKTNDSLVKAQGTILNIPKLQETARYSGFLNNLSDQSGITRSIPLVISFNDRPFPSLALEASRIALNQKKVTINYDELGVENITIGDLKIPTTINGKMILNFRGEAKTFKYISAVDIIQNNFNKKDINNKIIFIGTSALGLLDLRAVPFDPAFPGVEVHANAVDNILNEDFLYTPNWAGGIDILHILLLSIIVIFIFLYSHVAISFIIISTIFIGDFYSIYFLLIHYGIILNILFPLFAIIVSMMGAIVMKYIFELRENGIIKSQFSRKISKNVMEQLLASDSSNVLAATSREVTIFFSDIRSFTSISESIKDPKDLLEFLNAYMEPMSQIIVEHNGTIDKFIGDAIMAYWNAPVDVENHADMAVSASLMQLEKLEKLNKTNSIKIEIGIGLNTGEATVGDMGSKSRSDYTVIGDSINLGSRLESLCKFYGSTLNISNFTKKRLTKKYSYRFLDLVTVKGKSEPVEIWQIHQFGEPTGNLKKELDLYHAAISRYRNQRFKEALDILQAIEKSPHITNKKIYEVYIKRCESYILDKNKTFSRVFEHKDK